MARTKVIAEMANPLQRMFGAFMRLERTRLDYSSAEVAARLGLSDTYLRLAEAGRATLNQSLVFKIIEVFADSNAPTHDSRTINIMRLALFMIGMHWVGAEMAAHPDKNYAFEAMANLAERVTDFQIFFERTKDYFRVENRSDETERAFLENIGGPEVGEFLRSDSYGGQEAKEIETNILPLRDLLPLPTLNIDIILDLKHSLAGRSFVHTTDVASKWEDHRASQFVYERGLYRDSNLIVSKSNLAIFHYNHLAETSFKGVQMIFKTSSAKSSGALRNTFFTELNAGRVKVGREPLNVHDLEHKVLFKILTPDQQATHQNALEKIWRRNTNDPSSLSHDAYWSFETRSLLPIGFVGWHDNKSPESTRNLTLSEAIEKDRLFKSLWKQLS